MSKSSNYPIDMPHSIDAEQAVLGALMLDNDRWDDVVTLIQREDFFSSPHRSIFKGIDELARGNNPFDLITLSELLERHNILDQCGGFAYLAELSKNTPSAANILAYARIIAEKSQLRQLYMLGNQLTRDVQLPNAAASNITEVAESQLFNLAEKGHARQHQEITVLDGMSQLLTRLEETTGGNGITGTPTGFRVMDQMTCGLQAGDLILLAARPSMGKTALALAMCEAALDALESNLVFCFSLEMPAEQLMMRLVAMLGQVELNLLRSGQLDDECWARISMAMERVTAWKDRLIIDENSDQTPALLRARARRYIRKYGQPSLILVDYLQLMRAPEQENRTQEISEISRCLKALAKELKCPLVALSQLNRQVESRPNKRPNNGDLRDSGALEQDADLILFIYRDEVYNENSTEKGIAEIIIGKQRQGPIGTVKTAYDGRYTRFSNAENNSYHFGYGRAQA